MSIERFIEDSNGAASAEELFDLFMQELKKLGFDRVIYSFMTSSPLLEQTAEHGVIRNYPDDWMKHYAEQDYIRFDPVYRAALVTRIPFFWSELMREQKLGSKQKRVMLEAAEAGLKDGVGISIHGATGETVGFGLSSATGGVELSRNTLSKAYLLAQQFHLCYTELLGHDLPLRAPTEQTLSAREREILLWCANNRSTDQIADLLQISTKTVDFHISNVFRKLGVNSRIAAVLKAFRLGMIPL